MSGHGVCDCAVKRGYWATFDRGIALTSIGAHVS
jgi:hypothetical protein